MATDDGEFLDIEERDDGLHVVAPLMEGPGDSGSVGCSVLLFFAFLALVSAMFYLVVTTFDPNDLGQLGSLYIFVPALGIISVIAVSTLLTAPRFKELHIAEDGAWRLETYAKWRFFEQPSLVRSQSLDPRTVRRIEVVEAHRRHRPLLVIQGPDEELLFGDILASRLGKEGFSAFSDRLETLADRLRGMAEIDG